MQIHSITAQPLSTSPLTIPPRIPLYYEAKVLFVLSLWHPATQGSEYLYHTMVEPLLSAQEPHIDAAIADSQRWIKSHVTNNLDGCALLFTGGGYEVPPVDVCGH